MPNTLTLSWTLELLARRAGETFDRPTGFVTEFDCELNINWWQEGDGFDYELDYVAMEETSFCDRYIICKETDPVLWPVLERSFNAATRNINDALNVAIIEKCATLASEARYFAEAAE